MKKNSWLCIITEGTINNSSQEKENPYDPMNESEWRSRRIVLGVKVSIKDKWFCLFVSIGKERKNKEKKKSILYKYSVPKKDI